MQRLGLIIAKNVGFILSISLFLSACVGAVPEQSLRVYDQGAYDTNKFLFVEDLRKQKIDTEVSGGLGAKIGNRGTKKARELYKRLSLSFRYTNEALQQEHLFSKENLSANTKVKMYNYGFQIHQGAERISATILAELDWGSDGVWDYLVSYRIDQDALNLTVGSNKVVTQMPSREYILLIRNIDLPVYQAEILYIHDYVKQSTGFYSEVYTGHDEAKDSIFQEHGAISFEQGQDIILSPPEKQKDEPEKDVRKLTQ